MEPTDPTLLNITPTIRNLSPTRGHTPGTTPRPSIEQPSPNVVASSLESLESIESMQEGMESIDLNAETQDPPSPKVIQVPLELPQESQQDKEKREILTSQIITKQKLMRELLERLEKTQGQVGKTREEAIILYQYVQNMLGALGPNRDNILKANKMLAEAAPYLAKAGSGAVKR